MLISAEIGVFLPKFCFVNLRQLSVNRNSVSVNFTETIYGRTLVKRRSVAVSRQCNKESALTCLSLPSAYCLTTSLRVARPLPSPLLCLKQFDRISWRDVDECASKVTLNPQRSYIRRSCKQAVQSSK